MKLWFSSALVAALTLLPGVALGQDADGDGRPAGALDCDDTDPTVYLNAPEVCDDGIDQSCDGQDLVSDEDGDGYENGACGPPATDLDCDDTLPHVNPGAPEELCNGVDDDCDQVLHPDELDEDGDGFLVCTGDCNDQSSVERPQEEEIWSQCNDGADNDCDGFPDGGDTDCWSSPTVDGGGRVQLVVAGPASIELTPTEVGDLNEDDELELDWSILPLAGTPLDAVALVPGDSSASVDLTPEGAGPWVYRVTLTVTDPAALSDSVDWTVVFVPELLLTAGPDGANDDPASSGCSHGAGEPASGLILLALVVLLLGRRQPALVLGALLVACPAPLEEPSGPDPDDQDGDGVLDEDDCEPRQAQIHAGAVDEWGDFVDTDCDGGDGIDRDGDGYPADGPGVTDEVLDCDDEDPTVHPWAPEWSLDGKDNDCDGFADPDGWSREESGDVPDVVSNGFTVSYPSPGDVYLDLAQLSGARDRFSGRIEPVEEGTWDGDNDALQVEMPFEGVLEVRLSWPDPATDLDLWIACFYEDRVNPENWYSTIVAAPDGSGLATEAFPESGRSVVVLGEGDLCRIVVFHYSGPATDYTLELGATAVLD